MRFFRSLLKTFRMSFASTYKGVLGADPDNLAHRDLLAVIEDDDFSDRQALHQVLKFLRDHKRDAYQLNAMVQALSRKRPHAFERFQAILRAAHEPPSPSCDVPSAS